MLHRAFGDDRLLIFPDEPTRSIGGRVRSAYLEASDSPATQWRGHRAIGVVYRPQFEQYGNYVPSVLPKRYDAFLYLEQSQALRPIHLEVHDEGEVPETYPSGV